MHESRTAGAAALVLASAALVGAPHVALAYSSYDTSTTILNNGGLSCAACHGATQTCNGCHAHGTHSGNAKSDINLVASLAKTTFAAGDPVAVTVSGGYRNGFARVGIFDEAGNKLAQQDGELPITVSVPAPATAGTYTWRAAWFGNQYDLNYPTIGSPTYGSGESATIRPGYFTPVLVLGTTKHGWQTVAVPSFTVQAAAAPSAALSPASLAFGSVTVGATKTLSTQVQNAGTAALAVTAIAPCAGTPALFTWTPQPSFDVPAGGSTTLQVTYAPTAASAVPAGACLTVTTNDPAHPTLSLTLSGAGSAPPAPSASLSPATLAFGSVSVGGSRALTASVQNTGNATLTVTSVAPCSGTPALFTWTPQPSFNVAAGGSTALQVTYAPTSAVALPAGACLAVATNDTAHPTLSLAVTGAGVAAAAPAIALSPASLAFGDVRSGTAASLSTAIQNTGTASLNVSSITRCAGTPTTITWSPAAPIAVAAGASAPLQVQFAPTSTGALPAGACLLLASDDPARPTVQLTLTGSGVPPPAPLASLDPGSLDFGAVTVGGSRTLATQVRNTGTAAFDVTAIARCTGTPTTISWSPASPFTVAAGQGAPLQVSYAPTSTAALPPGACVTIATTDPAHPTLTLALSGAGTAAPAPAIALTPAALAFGDVTVGQSATLPLEVRNTGTAALQITGVSRCAATPADVTWSPGAPQTVAAGAAVTVEVSYAPTASGALPAGACLSLTSDDPARPTSTVAITGAGIGASPPPAQQVPVFALQPSAIDFGAVTVGEPRTLTVDLQNAGSALLTVTSVTPCAGTTGVTWSPGTPLTIAPASGLELHVTYAPAAAGALASDACLDIASDDPAHPSRRVALAGSAVAPAASLTPAAPAPQGGGCASGEGSAPALAALGLAVLLARAVTRRRWS